ncbi:hypothetical protein M885DRAFT_587567 [Pelagophyceae sp. CCMP2097]|nr:hypothetical protein M885DRAFT_587567 [Pelagophyceae sp. CCMP2097]
MRGCALLLCILAAWGSPNVDETRAAISAAKASILALYGEDVTAVHFSPPDFYDAAARDHIVERMLRAFVLGDSFVVAVGGMSDVAGHGNMFEESYPIVCRDALAPVFAAAGIRFNLRNMAMGGVPSYPSSVCMEDNFGADVDLVVWDFRMVERDEVKGELYLRQAMMMPKAPSVMFKRKNGYLKSLGYAYDMASLHVVDEMDSYNRVKALKSPGVIGDKFCEGVCECPGQVRWHSGWKLQRFRGLHMAWVYLDMLRDAVKKYEQMQGVLPPAGDKQWAIEPRTGADMPPPVSKQCHAAFCSRAFKCGLTWSPTVGRRLVDLVDPQLGLNGWQVRHPSKRIAELSKNGHGKCHYQDEKQSLVGDASSHWIFFNLPGVAAQGTIAFCGDFKSSSFTDYALIVVNQEEVMDKLEPWLESKTLGISSSCFATSHNVVPGDNIIGFRVTSGDLALSLTHVIWT